MDGNIFINISETHPYVSKHDPNKGNPGKEVTFILGALDGISDDKLRDYSTTFEVDPNKPGESKAKTVMNFFQRNMDLLRLGLKDIQNGIDPATKSPLKFNTVATPKFGKSKNVASDRILAIIPRKIREDLAEEILRISGISEDEEKN